MAAQWWGHSEFPEVKTSILVFIAKREGSSTTVQLLQVSRKENADKRRDICTAMFGIYTVLRV